MEQNYKLDKIRELSGNDQEFIETLAMTFLEEVPADARLLKIAVDSADHLATYKAAHKMKGSSLNIGAYQLANICYTIEKAAIENNPNLIAEQTDSMGTILEQSISELIKIAEVT